jgi:hypothetical protein
MAVRPTGRGDGFRLPHGKRTCGPQHFLRNFQGILQTDAYQAYDKVGGSGMVQAGCWTHARRGFANLVKLNPGDPVASPIVAWINQLFAVDGEARERGLSLDQHHQLRQQKAPALLEKIKTAVEAAQAGVFPVGCWQSPANIPWDNGRNSPVFCSTRS